MKCSLSFETVRSLAVERWCVPERSKLALQLVACNGWVGSVEVDPRHDNNSRQNRTDDTTKEERRLSECRMRSTSWKRVGESLGSLTLSSPHGEQELSPRPLNAYTHHQQISTSALPARFLFGAHSFRSRLGITSCRVAQKDTTKKQRTLRA